MADEITNNEPNRETTGEQNQADKEKDPRLDPDSPEFDREYFDQIKASIEAGVKEASSNLSDMLAEKYGEIGASIIGDEDYILQNIKIDAKEILEDVVRDFESTWADLQEVLPSPEQLNAMAMVNYGFQLAADELARQNGITVDEIISQGEDENGDAIQGSLFGQAGNYGFQFSTLMAEELRKDIYQGKTFLGMVGDYGKSTEDGQRLIVTPGSPLDLAIEAVRKQTRASFDLQYFSESGTTSSDKKKFAPIVKPQSFKILNSKLANKYISLQDSLTQLDSDGQLTFLPLDDSDNQDGLIVRKATAEKKQVVDIVSLSYYGDMDGKVAKIMGYDQSVLNTVCSLLLAGNKAFLVDDIVKTMTQKSSATAAQMKRVKESLTKLSGHRIRIDVSQELKENLLKIDNELVINGILEDNLLHFRSLYIKTEKGKEKEAIEILSEPILLTYSQGKHHQIITEPVELLEMDCKANEETIPIRDYLIKEIHQLKRGYRDNPLINYDNLLKYGNFDQSKRSRTEKSRITSEVITILDGFIKKGFIKGYEIKNGQRNRIIDFEIKV